jgi:hypothetical protein
MSKTYSLTQSWYFVADIITRYPAQGITGSVPELEVKLSTSRWMFVALTIMWYDTHCLLIQNRKYWILWLLIKREKTVSVK